MVGRNSGQSGGRGWWARLVSRRGRNRRWRWWVWLVYRDGEREWWARLVQLAPSLHYYYSFLPCLSPCPSPAPPLPLPLPPLSHTLHICLSKMLKDCSSVLHHYCACCQATRLRWWWNCCVTRSYRKPERERIATRHSSSECERRVVLYVHSLSS